MRLRPALRDAQQEERERVCPICGAELADDQQIYFNGWDVVGCSSCISTQDVRDYFG